MVLTSRAKKVFVGDPYQQIYAFNGAVNALTKAASQGAASYFLTQSFRCPDDIAKKANQYLKLLGAPKPFRGLNEPKTKEKTSGQLIIARTNAGLFDFVAKQLPKKFFFYIGGFEGYEFDTILDVVRLLTNTPNDVKDIFLRNFSCFSQLESYAERAKDTVLTSRIRIAKRYKKRSFSLFRDMWVNQVFKESEADYIATTAHKIKGQEHQQVCLLDDFVSLKDIVDKAEEQKTLASLGGPRVLADDPYLSLEEFRLLYVSITRSFNSLNMPARYQLSDEAIDQFKELCSSGFIGLKEGPNFLDPNSNPQTLVSPSDS
ncbi:MAG: hypothetical protein LBE31_01930 [Deltaproteobacteria bacterium]|nr:hypothetical protein [Deltaproteobacteria bacterium]